ncbi:MAG: MFS transporter [Proteobacteria bacterium]|nr:MFS transporter [Pseudomonadota bacterium]
MNEKTRSRATLTVCSTTHVLHDGLADTLYVLLPLLAQAFGLSFSQVGLIRSANKAAMAALQIPAGMLAERVGERSLLAAGTVLSGLAFLFLGLSSGFLALLALLFLAGVGGAVQHPLCSALVARAYEGGYQRTALGTYNFAGDVGKLAFAGLTSLALLAGIAWQGPPLAFGVAGIGVGVGLFVALRWLGAGERPAAPAALAREAHQLGWGIRSPSGFVALSAITVLDNSTRNGFLTFVAFLLIAKGADEGAAAAAIPLVFVGGMMGKLACGMLADRIGIIRTVVLTEVATGAGILAVIVLPMAPAYALLPALGVALNGTSSVLYGTISELVERERRSRAFGLFYTLGSTCGIVAPLGYGLLGDVIGIPATMAVIGTVILFTVPLCLVLRPAVAGASVAGAA